MPKFPKNNIKHSQLVIALANGEDRKSLAARFEVSERTLIRWLQSDTFQREYQEACQQLYRVGEVNIGFGSSDRLT